MEEKKRRRIECEFGVPIAGEILDPAQWTQTALKVPEGTLDWGGALRATGADRSRPWLRQWTLLPPYCVWRPDHDHLAVDILPVVIRYATRRGNQRGLTEMLALP